MSTLNTSFRIHYALRTTNNKENQRQKERKTKTNIFIIISLSIIISLYHLLRLTNGNWFPKQFKTRKQIKRSEWKSKTGQRQLRIWFSCRSFRRSSMWILKRSTIRARRCRMRWVHIKAYHIYNLLEVRSNDGVSLNILLGINIFLRFVFIGRDDGILFFLLLLFVEDSNESRNDWDNITTE